MRKKNSVVYARESALVDAQILIQSALNETLGNPRDYEESDPDKARRLFSDQRRYLAKAMGVNKRAVNKLFSDNASLPIKDLAHALHVLGYALILDSKRIE